MATAELRQFITEKLQQWDPTADVSEGSPADIRVISPILERLGSDPFETDISDFLISRFRSDFPDIDIESVGSSWADAFGAPAKLTLEPFKREILNVKTSLSIADPDLLTENEMDALAANYFEERDYGSLGTSVLRVFFYRPQKLIVDGTVYATTASGLRYYASSLTTFSAEQMQQNVEEDLYYVDFPIQAEREGDAYNVEKGAINTVYGIPTAVKATNLTDITDARAKETNQRFKDRIEAGISQRALNTDRGIRVKILTAFPEIQALTTIGYGDVEMERDILQGVVEMYGDGFGLGDVFLSGTTTSIVSEQFPPGSGRVTESYSSRIEDTLAHFDTGANPVQVGDNIFINGEDRTVYEVLSDTELRVADLINIFASGGLTGSRPTYPLPRGSDLPITNIYEDSGGALFTYGRSGYYIVPYDGAMFPDADYKEIDSALSAGSLKIVPDIVIRRYGRSPNAVPDTHFALYYTAVVGGGPPVVGHDLEWDGGAESARIDSVNTSERLIMVSAATSMDLSAGDELVESATGAYTVVLDDPPVGRKAEFVLATNRLQTIAMGGTHYDFTSTSPIGPPARIGDWVAMTDETTGNVYGIARIVDVDPTYLELDPGPGATAPWPSYPAGPLSIVSWTVIDGTLFTDPEEFFEADAGPEHFAIFSFADYVEYGAFNFLNHGGGPYEYLLRRPLTADEVNANLKLVISGIPGGILYPNTPEGTIEIVDEEVHVGGMTDIYNQPLKPDTDTYTLPLTVDNDPFLSGNDLTWAGGDNRLSSAEFDSDLEGKVVVIQEGEYAGAYRILYSTAGLARIDTVLTNGGAGIQFYVTDGFTMDLSDPEISRISYREDLVTSLSSYVKAGTPGSYIDFAGDHGVLIGDTLEILDGADKGTYTINNITDSGSTLVLDTTLSWIGTDIPFKIYRQLTSIIRPLIRVRSVDMVDENGRDLGLTIPPKDPVDIRSGEMTNAGHGTKTPNANRTDPYVTGFGAAGQMFDVNADFEDDNVVPGDVLVIEEGLNVGTYIVETVDSGTELHVEGAWPDATDTTLADYTIGAPSTGGVRFYFLEPTYFEVTEDTRLYSRDGDKEYRGDIYASSEICRFTDESTDLETAGANTLSSTAVNFRQYEIAVGDHCILTTQRMDGDGIAADTVNVSGQSLILQFEDSAQQTVIFQGTNPIPLTESGYPGGVKEQIEAVFDNLYVEVVDTGGGAPYYLYLHSEDVFTLVGGSSTIMLSLDLLHGSTNEHAHAGEYEIDTLIAAGNSMTLLNLDGTVPVFGIIPGTRAVFRRERSQRIGPAAMSEQQDGTGLYYFDADIMSVRPGDEYSLADNTEMYSEDHRSFGYALSSRNEAYTFSDLEELDLILTPYVMDPTLDDYFTDLIMVPGIELRFALDYSESIKEIQQYTTSDFNRVVNNNPLARHYKPAYIRMALSYARGASSAVVKKAIVDHIRSKSVNAFLSAYDINRILVQNKVARVESEVELVGIIHQMDRTIRTDRTTTRLVTDRLTHVIPDEDWISITKTL